MASPFCEIGLSALFPVSKRQSKHPKELHNHSDGSCLRKAVPMDGSKLQTTGQTKAQR
jgi:hypothetical protein